MRTIENVRDFLETRVSAHPDSVCLVTTEGDSLTYVDFDQWVNRAANLMREIGVEKGDKVALILPNCAEYLYLWFGLAKIGAVHVAINTRLVGDSLRYQIEKSDTAAVVVHREFATSYDKAMTDAVEQRPVIYMEETNASGLRSELTRSKSSSPPEIDIEPGDPLVIMFTSGTTGLPKGVVNSHNAYVRAGSDLARLMGLTSSDRMYVFMPLFHGNPQMMGVMPILATGGSIALSPWFSASRFWDEIRSLKATAFTHIGSPLPILMKQPEHATDADNPIRVILGGAPPDVSKAFGERFRCSVLDGWGMIEAGCNTTITPADRVVAGTNGVPRECFDVRVFDDLDRELEAGEVGEIVVRPKEPYVMFSGYYNDPDRTLDAFRNLWFHTGDLGRYDTEGNLYFLGRSGDAIRRKGENISTIEIENTVNSHPSVEEGVAIGVPDEIAGQEIMVCLVTLADERLEPWEVIEWCETKLPEFMIPRYVRVLKEFPRTGSHKVQKYKLRELGAEGAWDRTAPRQGSDRLKS